MAQHVQRMGSFGFEGGRGRQQYWRDPARIIEETLGNWRPPQQKTQSEQKRIARIRPTSDFAAKLIEASKKLGLN